MTKKLIALTFCITLFGQAQPVTTMGTTKDGKKIINYGPTRQYCLKEENSRHGIFHLISGRGSSSGASVFILNVDKHTRRHFSKKFLKLELSRREALTQHALYKMKRLETNNDSLSQRSLDALIFAALHMQGVATHGLHHIETAMLYFVLYYTNLLEDLERNAVESLRHISRLRVDTSSPMEEAAAAAPAPSPTAYLGFGPFYFIQKDLTKSHTYSLVNRDRKSDPIIFDVKPEEREFFRAVFYSYDETTRVDKVKNIINQFRLTRTVNPLHEVLHHGLDYLIKQYGSIEAMVEPSKVQTPADRVGLPESTHGELQEILLMKIIEVVGL
jgi:hypothetical protein